MSTVHVQLYLPRQVYASRLITVNAMENPIARSAAVAPYARIKQHLKDGLASGHWPPGAAMPSEADLVAQFGVSRMTVTRAMNELRAEGLIDRVQGVGTFAAHLIRVASTLHIRDLHKEISERGHRHHAKVHLSRQEPATEWVARRLGLATGAKVFHTLIVHFEDGVALQCEDRHVNPQSAPNYLDVDFTQVTPTQYLLDVAPFWEAQYAIEAALPSAREARLLGISRSDPCLVVQRRTVGRDVPITTARLVHPGSRYLLQGQFKP